MRKLPQAEAREHQAWLEAIETVDGWGAMLGYECSGWEDSVWILHSMHEDLRGFDVSYHEKLDEGRPGFVAPLPEEWRRARWSEIAETAGFTLGEGQTTPPSYLWLPRGRVADNIFGGWEASLVEADFDAIVDVVNSFAPASEIDCFAFYGWVSINHDFGTSFDELTMFEGPLTDVFALTNVDRRWYTTPNNLWPADRSWFAYTGVDLSATQISGSRAFIAAIEANEYLETMRWERPPAGDDNG